MESMLNDAIGYEEHSPVPKHNVNVKAFYNMLQLA